MNLTNLKHKAENAFNRAQEKVLTSKYLALRALDYHFFKATGRALDIHWIYPAKELEEKLNLSGISREYKMPNGKTMLRVAKETLYQDKNVTELNAVLKEIIALNPELSTISYDKTHERNIVDFIMGITSGFNPDDISFYLQTQPKDYNHVLTKAQLERLAVCDIFSEKLETPLGWIPSKQTLEKITQQKNIPYETLSEEALYKKALELEVRYREEGCITPELLRPSNNQKPNHEPS